MTKLKPFAHQKHSLAHDAKTSIVFDCSDPGTGKTAVAIWAFERRRKRGGGCALVLAPKSLLRTTWAADIKRFAPGLKASVATATDRGEMFAQDADIYITNIDASKWLAKQPKGFFAKFGTLIIDESSAYKHASSQRSRAVAKIVKHFKYRRAMTGTPNGRSITDVWHQVYLLDDGKRLGPSYYAFRNSVCEPKQVGRNANAIQWTDKDGAEEAVFGLISDIVIRHRFEDCIDIPENHRYTLEYELSPKQQAAYMQLEQTQLLMIKKATPKNFAAKLLGQPQTDTTLITAVNAAVVANKLLQVASGAIYEAPDVYHLIDDGRYKMVLDLVQERQHSLVFFLWKHQRDALIDEAERRGVTFCLLDGSTPERERLEYVQAYQAGKYQVMFAHPRSAAHGLTLTRGTTTIWASPTYDLELFEQGSKRQHRAGQTQKTETITILAPGTIDTRVYDILQTKNARMITLLDLFTS